MWREKSSRIVKRLTGRNFACATYVRDVLAEARETAMCAHDLIQIQRISIIEV
jgi:hypothetical protein